MGFYSKEEAEISFGLKRANPFQCLGIQSHGGTTRIRTIGTRADIFGLSDPRIETKAPFYFGGSVSFLKYFLEQKV